MRLRKFGVLGFGLALTACGSQIDERQTDVIQGLVYKHGDAAPFSGTVVHVKETMRETMTFGDCTVHYKEGLVEGKTECVASNGTKVFESNTVDEKPSGAEKHWSPDNGNLLHELSWDAGKKDGVEKIYDPTGKTLLHQITWSEGVRAGSEKVWNPDGKLTTDLNWQDGKQTGSQTTDTGSQIDEAIYKDGLLDGLQKVSDRTGVIEESPFEHGVLTGTQTFYRFGQPEVERKWDAGKVVSESITRHANKDNVYEIDTIQCDPACGADADPVNGVSKVDVSGATNRQVQFPAFAPPHIDTVDRADSDLDYDGFGTLKIVAPATQSLSGQPAQLDFSKIAKLETSFKNDKLDGVQRAYDASGAVILEAQIKDGQWISASGSMTGTPITNAQAAGMGSSSESTTTTAADKSYPNGMAMSFAQCSMPGFRTDSALCHPVGVPVPMPTTPAAPKTASAAALDSINDQLSTLGMLDAESLNPQGYPVMNVECNDQTKQCVNAGGTAIGDENDIAGQMLPVRQGDIISQNYKCDVICRDEQGDIIGRVPDFKSSK